MFNIEQFIRAQTCVGGKEDHVMLVLSALLMSTAHHICILPRGLIKLFILLGVEPTAMNNLALCTVGLGHIRQVLQPVIADRHFQY